MGATKPAVNTAAADASLDALLADLNLSSDEEIVESTEVIVAAGETTIEAASDEVGDEIQAKLDAQAKLLEDKAAAKVAAAAKKEADKAAKAAAAATAKAEKAKLAAEKKAAKEAAKAAKPAPVPRKFYASKVERITDHLGDKLGEYTVLEMDDALLEGDALKAAQDATLATIKQSGKKVQNRITFILEFIAGKSAKLNGVISTAVTLLGKDGKLTTGVEGNLHLALIAHPYSVNAAKAMGGNTVLALRALKVVVGGDKGVYVPNPNSLVLAKLQAMGL